MVKAVKFFKRLSYEGKPSSFKQTYPQYWDVGSNNYVPLHKRKKIRGTIPITDEVKEQ